MITQYHQITRDTNTKKLLNKIETKEFDFFYDKIVIVENFDTIPFGYYNPFLLLINNW
jgi:hypothetical protein